MRKTNMLIVAVIIIAIVFLFMDNAGDSNIEAQVRDSAVMNNSKSGMIDTLSIDTFLTK